jgi:hypothetical protein
MAFTNKASIRFDLTPGAISLRKVSCGAFDAHAALSSLQEGANG